MSDAESPEAPFGYRPDGLPRKRRPGAGKPKGHPKTGGVQKHMLTGKEATQKLLPKWAETAEAILDGKPLRVSGPTGKPIKRIATMDEKISVLRMIGNKVTPDLQATQVTGANEEALIPAADPPSHRHVARVVLGILSHAKAGETDGQTIHEERTSKMSALPSKANILRGHFDVRFVPEADISFRQLEPG